METMSTREDEIKTAAVRAARRLGYPSLRNHQLEVIVRYVQGHDVFAILPTGYGKTLYYACLPLVFDELQKLEQPSIVYVVTPLTAIIEDQVSNSATLHNESAVRNCVASNRFAKSCMYSQYTYIYIYIYI